MILQNINTNITHLFESFVIFFFTGIILGLNKGHKVEAKAVAPRQAYKKGTKSNRTTFVRSLIREVAGLAPYERRVVDLIRNSGEKRAKKFAKKRLGTQKRALAKVEEMSNIIAQARKH